MIYKLQNANFAAAVFAGWEETIIWSCLEGIMGEVYADDPADPRSAMAALGDFCFFAGAVNEELLRYKAPNCNQDFRIMVPQNAK